MAIVFEVPDGQLKASYTFDLPVGIVPDDAKVVGTTTYGALIVERDGVRYSLAYTAADGAVRLEVLQPGIAERHNAPLPTGLRAVDVDAVPGVSTGATSQTVSQVLRKTAAAATAKRVAPAKAAVKPAKRAAVKKSGKKAK